MDLVKNLEKEVIRQEWGRIRVETKGGDECFRSKDHTKILDIFGKVQYKIN